MARKEVMYPKSQLNRSYLATISKKDATVAKASSTESGPNKQVSLRNHVHHTNLTSSKTKINVRNTKTVPVLPGSQKATTSEKANSEPMKTTSRKNS